MFSYLVLRSQSLRKLRAVGFLATQLGPLWKMYKVKQTKTYYAVLMPIQTGWVHVCQLLQYRHKRRWENSFNAALLLRRYLYSHSTVAGVLTSASATVAFNIDSVLRS